MFQDEYEARAVTGLPDAEHDLEEEEDLCRCPHWCFATSVVRFSIVPRRSAMSTNKTSARVHATVAGDIYRMRSSTFASCAIDYSCTTAKPIIAEAGIRSRKTSLRTATSNEPLCFLEFSVDVEETAWVTQLLQAQQLLDANFLGFHQ